MKGLVLDIETQNTFAEAGSSEAKDLDISVVGIYSYVRQEFRAFTQDQFSELWQYIQESDTIIGFNSNHFDIPLLNKYYPGDLSTIHSIDLLESVRASFGRRLKLDWLAEGTLNSKKSGDGLDAVRWWKAGEIEKIKKYCLDDVSITKKLFEYANDNKELKFVDLGTLQTIPIDITDWDDEEESVKNGVLNF